MDRRDPLRVPARTLNRPVSEHPPPGRRVHSVVAGRAAGPGSEVGWAGWVNERGGAWPHPPLRFHARAVQLAKRPLHRPAPAVPGHAARPERRRWVWLVLVHGGGQVKRRYAPRAPPPPPPPPPNPSPSPRDRAGDGLRLLFGVLVGVSARVGGGKHVHARSHARRAHARPHPRPFWLVDRPPRSVVVTLLFQVVTVVSRRARKANRLLDRLQDAEGWMQVGRGGVCAGAVHPPHMGGRTGACWWVQQQQQQQLPPHTHTNTHTPARGPPPRLPLPAGGAAGAPAAARPTAKGAALLRRGLGAARG